MASLTCLTPGSGMTSHNSRYALCFYIPWVQLVSFLLAGTVISLEFSSSSGNKTTLWKSTQNFVSFLLAAHTKFTTRLLYYQVDSIIFPSICAAQSVMATVIVEAPVRLVEKVDRRAPITCVKGRPEPYIYKRKKRKENCAGSTIHSYINTVYIHGAFSRKTT